jgi:hypothetical protein
MIIKKVETTVHAMKHFKEFLHLYFAAAQYCTAAVKQSLPNYIILISSVKNMAVLTMGFLIFYLFSPNYYQDIILKHLSHTAVAPYLKYKHIGQHSFSSLALMKLG